MPETSILMLRKALKRLNFNQGEKKCQQQTLQEEEKQQLPAFT